MKCSNKNCSKWTASLHKVCIDENFDPPPSSIKNCGDCGRSFCTMHLTASVWHKNGKLEKYNPSICHNCVTQRKRK